MMRAAASGAATVAKEACGMNFKAFKDEERSFNFVVC